MIDLLSTSSQRKVKILSSLLSSDSHVHIKTLATTNACSEKTILQDLRVINEHYGDYLDLQFNQTIASMHVKSIGMLFSIYAEMFKIRKLSILSPSTIFPFIQFNM